MNYDLVEKLKDAGFPKEINLYAYNKEVGNEPTLIELLDAIGEKFHCLTYRTGPASDTGKTIWWWEATTIDEFAIDLSSEGAVAKLWLKLNT